LQSGQAGNVILVEPDYPRRTPQALAKETKIMNHCSKLEYKDFQILYFANL
jgi:hypothetical protein